MTPAEHGRIVYVTNCMVCHNPDPNLPGSKGPPIAGSSRELVYDRVLFLKYPPGYKPKRTTHDMRALPQLGESDRRLGGFSGRGGEEELKQPRWRSRQPENYRPHCASSGVKLD